MGLMQRRGESVLVIDDSESILEIERLALEQGGFTVYTAIAPKEGIEIYRQNSGKIQLVFLDYNMPEMNGDEVFRCLKEIRPDVKVCLVTSREDNEVFQLLREGVRCYIRKPFRLEEIIHCAQMAGAIAE